MNVPIRRVSTFPAWALAFAALFALACSADAAQSPVVVSDDSHATKTYIPAGSENPAIFTAFDDDRTTYINGSHTGAAIEIDFSQHVTTDKPCFYVSDIIVVNEGGRYSLKVSEDGTTWTDIPVIQNVTGNGMATYPIGSRVLKVKYVFDYSTTIDLKELTVMGWPSSTPKVVSSYSIASFYNANGTAMEANGQGGNNGNAGQLFDGNFTHYLMWPRAHNGGYVVVDFTRNNGTTALKEYYITQMLVGSNGKKKFTLEYSEDGDTWKTVAGANAISYAGVKTNEVGVTARKVRYVWTEGSSWDFSTDYLAEFEVWGMDPNDLPCTHPSLDSVAWTAVENSATCTERGVDERICPDCGMRFTKSSPSAPPLGHDYVSTLTRPGSFKKYGTGSIACSRRSFRIDFTNTLESAITNGPIDLLSVGGLAMADLIQFTDVDVSSTDHLEWGANPFKMVNGTWTVSGGSWDSAGLDNQYADFIFGTEIDLTHIQIVLRNTAQTLLFFDVNDDTGEETPLTQFTILRTDVYTNAADLAAIPFPTQLVTQDDDRGRRIPYRFYPGGENGAWAPVLDYGRFGTDFWDSLVVTNDLNIPALRTNPDGTHPTHVDNGQTVDDSNGSNQFQAFLIRFYEQPCKHLRIRQDTTKPTGYTSWSGKDMSIIECHPWGIVKGASATRYRKEIMMIFR